jgi:hypothetical protein
MQNKLAHNLNTFRSCLKCFVLIIFSLMLISCGSQDKIEPADEIPAKTQDEPAAGLNRLTEEESAEGWILLFDGKTFEGWRGLGREGIPEGHWIIEDGTIKKVPSENVPLQEDGQPLVGGDLMTIAAFENFELYFEWKISPAGNSGVKYNVSEEMSTAYPPQYAALGFEYQILDDEGNLDARVGENHTAAALYDLIAPEGKNLEPVGKFNSSRIILNGNHGEHWLNGVKVLEYDLESPAMQAQISASKYKDIPDFAKKRRGHIVLQDHTDAVWFRNLKIRLLGTDGYKIKPKTGWKDNPTAW